MQQLLTTHINDSQADMQAEYMLNRLPPIVFGASEMPTWCPIDMAAYIIDKAQEEIDDEAECD